VSILSPSLVLYPEDLELKEAGGFRSKALWPLLSPVSLSPWKTLIPGDAAPYLEGTEVT
jgi:hypothetical protein